MRTPKLRSLLALLYTWPLVPLAAQVATPTDRVVRPAGTITRTAPGMTALVPPLPGPANLALTPGATMASLRWDAAPGAIGYMVTRSSALYGQTPLMNTPITGTSFTDVTQHFDPRYLHTYTVLAVFADGRNGASSVTHLPAPSGVSTVYNAAAYACGPASFTTRWTAVPEATSYAVQYRLSLTDGRNYLSGRVDSAFTVAAPTASHTIAAYRPGCEQAGPTAVQAAVAAIFPNGARSAATAAP